MNSSDFIKKATTLVAKDSKLHEDKIHVVWYAWVMGNQKSMLTTDVSGDGLYFEVTYNKEEDEFYLDRYVKESHARINN